jgi:hypothetical protein
VSRRIVIVIAALLAPAACWVGPTDAPASLHPPRPTGIRAINWQNRTYELDDYGAVKVKNGRGELPLVLDDDGSPLEPGEIHGVLSVGSPLFTDVNGDGADEAVILSMISTGGTARLSQVLIFTLHDEHVVPLATIIGGDRGDGGIHTVSIDGGAILVLRNVRGPGDGLCCASGTRRERWVWRYGEMVEDEDDDDDDDAAKPPPP